MVYGSRSHFGQSSSSPFGSLGVSSSPAFGTTMSAFGVSSTPAFGASLSPGMPVFDQKPNLGAFWSNPAQTSPFGSMTQPSQPAFGSNMFGTSTPFGGSQSAFGTTSTPPFGAKTLPFGAIGTPPFGATSSQAFGGTSTPAFGTTRCPAFGSTGAGFGASSTQAFGSSSFPFATPTPTISAPGFSSSSSPSFGFPSPPAFGQSNSTFGASSPSVQSFPFGAQATTPTFWNTGFGHSAYGGRRGGSRVATYTGTLASDSFSNWNSATMVKLMSISAMPIYIDKSHEELRCEDYHLGDKGGLTPAGGSDFDISTTQSGPLNPTSVVAQSCSCPFNTSTSSSIYAPKIPPFTETGFGTSSSAFSSSSSSPFWPSTTTNRFTPPPSSPSVFELFGQTSPPSILSTPTTSSFTFPAPSSNSTFNFNSTASIAQTGGAFGQTSTSFWPNQTPFGQTNMFNTPSTGVSTTTIFFAPSSSSPSVFGQKPSPFSSQTISAFPFSAPASTSTSTYNSGLHNFTPSIPQTGGTFGQTSTPFGQNISNTPFTGFGLGSSSAAIPTSNPIGFSQPAFVDKDLDKDMDMDDWVLC